MSCSPAQLKALAKGRAIRKKNLAAKKKTTKRKSVRRTPSSSAPKRKRKKRTPPRTDRYRRIAIQDPFLSKYR